jgi:hypothetical protein
MKYPILAAAAAALLTTGAALQAQPAGPEGAAPPAASAPATADSYTDTDLKAFARAAIAAGKIQQDTTIAATEKQPKMLAAVQAEGLDPAKFNAIAQASQSDPALKAKIQAAATADAGAQPAPSKPTP